MSSFSASFQKSSEFLHSKAQHTYTLNKSLTLLPVTKLLLTSKGELAKIGNYGEPQTDYFSTVETTQQVEIPPPWKAQSSRNRRTPVASFNTWKVSATESIVCYIL